MRGRDHAEGADAVGVPRGDDPGQQTAPVVANQVEGVHVHGIGQGQHVGQQMGGRVVGDFGGPGTAAVAAQVGGDGAVAGLAELPELVAPGPRCLWEPVQQQDASSLVRAAGAAGEDHAGRLDLEPVDRPRGRGHVRRPATPGRPRLDRGRPRG